jgi:hypothetical protein
MLDVQLRDSFIHGLPLLSHIYRIAKSGMIEVEKKGPKRESSPCANPLMPAGDTGRRWMVLGGTILLRLIGSSYGSP